VIVVSTSTGSLFSRNGPQRHCLTAYIAAGTSPVCRELAGVRLRVISALRTHSFGLLRHGHEGVPAVNIPLEVGPDRLSGVDLGKLLQGGVQEIGYESLNLFADSGLIQGRRQLRLRDMRKSPTQRTFHNVVVYHCHPPGDEIWSSRTAQSAAFLFCSLENER
jgi:hypothetical protein